MKLTYSLQSNKTAEIYFSLVAWMQVAENLLYLWFFVKGEICYEYFI